MLPYIITQLFSNVKFFPAQGGSYKEILHFVHLLNALCVPLHVEIRYDEQNLWSDKSARFIRMCLSPGTERHMGRSLQHRILMKYRAYHHTPLPPIGREAALSKKLHLPNQSKTSPQDPATTKNESNFCFRNGGVLWGSSREVREVWRVGTPLRKRGSCASKVFLSPRKFSHNNHHTCA